MMMMTIAWSKATRLLEINRSRLTLLQGEQQQTKQVFRK